MELKINKNKLVKINRNKLFVNTVLTNNLLKVCNLDVYFHLINRYIY